MCLYALDYMSLVKEFSKIKHEFPFVSLNVIGQSLCKRNIYSLNFGRGKKHILFASCFHGMEGITTAVVLKFFKMLCKCYKEEKNYYMLDPKNFFNSATLHFVPRVNPDGTEIQLYGPSAAKKYQDIIISSGNGNTSDWQANAAGVDLNHNFNADFFTLREIEKALGYTSPGPTRYGGLFPESEPESFALASLVRKIPFSFVMAFHSQGEEIYFSYKDKIPKNTLEIANEFSKYSGYKITVPSSPIASLGGFKDYFINCFSRPGFTIEIGKGKNPLPEKDYKDVFLKTEKAMCAVLAL